MRSTISAPTPGAKAVSEATSTKPAALAQREATGASPHGSERLTRLRSAMGQLSGMSPDGLGDCVAAGCLTLVAYPDREA
jgi:hypothetical protein